MKKSLIIFIAIANLLWALLFSYIVLNMHTDKWYLKGIVIYPVILFFSFTIKFMDKENDKLAHFLTIGMFSITMLVAVGFIFS